MYCSKCGKEINENSNFCSHCGNSNNINSFHSTNNYSPRIQTEKSMVPIILFNILWAGSGYFYLGQHALAGTLCFLNLCFIWTGVVPLLLCIVSCIGGYQNIQKLKKGLILKDWEMF